MSIIFLKNFCEGENQLNYPSGFLSVAEDKDKNNGNKNY